MYPYIIQGNNVTVVIDNVPHTISKTHVTYQKVVDAIKANDWDTVKDVIEPKKVVLNYGKGNVSIQGQELFWKGEPLHNSLAMRMIQMLQDGFPIEPMVNFMENLMQNPSKRSVTELYGFLEKNNLPITPDGHFLAYKRVRANYTDCHTGKMDNSIGCVVEMERNLVDDDKDRTCSTGLHFCSQEYLRSFGGERTVIVKINPRDVVSIPSDYNDSKGRACRYEVIGEVDRDPVNDKEFSKAVQTNANSFQPVKPAKVEQVGPKLGSTEFYRGYTDGFTGADQAWYGSQNYVEGFEKGYNDKYFGPSGTPRYQYVPVTQPTQAPASKGSYVWPQPQKRG